MGRCRCDPLGAVPQARTQPAAVVRALLSHLKSLNTFKRGPRILIPRSPELGSAAVIPIVEKMKE